MNAPAQRIAVDLNLLLPPGENGGAATATLQMLGEVAGRGRDLLLLVDETNAAGVDHLIGPHTDRYIVRRTSIKPREDRRKEPWPHRWSLVRALGADVLFCPFGDPFWAEDGVPTLCTINDLQHLDHPEFFTPEQLAHRSDYLRRLVGVADHVIVPSGFTKRSVESHLALRTPIDVVPYPALRSWATDAGRRSLAPAAAGDEPFLLYPANAWPHKNHGRLLAAMVIHQRRCALASTPPVRLVLTGSLLGTGGLLEKSVADLGLTDLVHVLGYVSDAELRDLYEQATGLIFPSLYEGFGLPVLEAMALEVPVACSRAASLSEVAGDAALFFDAEDPVAIADAIDALVGDEARRRDLVARGRRQAARFATDAAVDALLLALDATAGQPRDTPVARPSFAVVMPSYQQASFIGRTIASLHAQGDVVREIVVCDGGSTDGTIDILSSHDSTLRWVSEPDGGQAAAVNKAISMVSGDVIAWLNSDDVYYDGALDTVATVLAWHPDIEWLYFAADHISSSDDVIEPYPNQPWDPAVFRGICFICQPACFFRRRAAARVGGLNESLRFCMDYELWFRLAEVQSPMYVPIVLAGSRLHPDTKTVGQRAEVLDEIVKMLVQTHGKASQRWLLGQIGDRVDRVHGKVPLDLAASRRRHRFALALAARTFLRHRAVPEPAVRDVLATWAREAARIPDDSPLRRGARPPVLAQLGARLSPRTRRRLSAPYHASTRWVRRRTLVELEPRLEALEQGLAELREALGPTDVPAEAPTGVSTTVGLERIMFAHHQVEEALVERLSAEIDSLRAEVERLQVGDEDA